jgi:hypothetical protein
MNHPTAKDLLLQNLPPELRPYFDRCLHRLSPHPDDPLLALFAILTESHRTNTAVIVAKLVEFEQREKQRDGQLAKDRAAHLDAVRKEIRALSGTTPKRIIASRIIGAVIWIAIVAGMTPYVVKKQVGTVDPKFHHLIETLGEESKAQQAQLDKIRENQKKTVEFIESVKQSASMTTTYTSVGQVMARYIKAIDHSNMTLEIPEGRSGSRMLTVPHLMSGVEYTKFKLAYMLPKTVEK